MAHLKLTLDTRKIKANYTYPIIFRISLNGASRSINTGFYLHQDYWNQDTKAFKKNALQHQHYSNRLKELEADYLNKMLEIERTNKHYSIQELKNFLTKKMAIKNTVLEFWKDEIQLLRKSNRNGGATVYQDSLNAFSKIKSLDISFEKIDYPFLRELEANLLSNGLKVNSIGIYMRSFRAVYNKAIKSKVTSLENYPFKEFKIKKAPTSPRPISLDEVRKYFQLDIAKSSTLYDSWLIGKLIFMLIGINSKDLLLLNANSVTNGRIIYKRAKTGKIYSIKLLSEAECIITYFNQRCGKTILNKLTEDDLANKIKLVATIKQKTKNFNVHLCILGKLISCEEKLTTYVFRYTWANIAKQLGYSKDLIAEALGHEYGNKVTGIYLEAYDKVLIDEMNQRIYEEIVKV